MEISYKTAELRDKFRYSDRLLSEYGGSVARMLVLRFTDLRAAKNMKSFRQLADGDIQVDGALLKLQVGGRVVLVLEPRHGGRAAAPDDDPLAIKRVKIISIEGIV